MWEPLLMAREELRLVTDFAELRAGMPVHLTGCALCERKHEAMVLSTLADRNGEMGWEVVPSPHPGRGKCLVMRRTVARGLVYVRVDGLESDATTTRTRELERTR
jgi:hypothetical protein